MIKSGRRYNKEVHNQNKKSTVTRWSFLHIMMNVLSTKYLYIRKYLTSINKYEEAIYPSDIDYIISKII